METNDDLFVPRDLDYGREINLDFDEIFLHPELRYYKTHYTAKAPEYGTERAACFDLSVCIGDNTVIEKYNEKNEKSQCQVFFNKTDGDKKSILIGPGDRVLVPTGLIFEIPQAHSVRLHPRSGMSLKQGLVLANAEGVIDEDYREEVKVILWNTSNCSVFIEDGQRICQGELVPTTFGFLKEVESRPNRVGDRTGGFGSTGTT